MPARVLMPSLGEFAAPGVVKRWLLQEGDQVEEFESLLEVEFGQLSSQIPSPASGLLLKIIVPEGEEVPAGTLLALVGEAGEPVVKWADALGEVVGRENGVVVEETLEPQIEQENPPDTPPKRPANLGFISPAVSRLARQFNIDLTRVRGSGEGGRVTRQDVLDYIEGRQSNEEGNAEDPDDKPDWTEEEAESSETNVDESPIETDIADQAEDTVESTGNQPPSLQDDSVEELQPTTNEGVDALLPEENLEIESGSGVTEKPQSQAVIARLRAAIPENGIRMPSAPYATTVKEADLRAVVTHREDNKSLFLRDGARLTYTAYIVAAAVTALKAFPAVNAGEDSNLPRSEINIGLLFHLNEPAPLVPVICRADGYSLLGLARAVNELSGHIYQQPHQSQVTATASFVIANHGINGALMAIPPLYPPYQAILGVGTIGKRPVVINDAIAIRPMVYLALTYNPQVLDSSTADKFLAKMVETLENWGQAG